MKRSKIIVPLGLFVFLGVRTASALMVETEKYDAAASYPAVAFSTNIVFLNPCSRIVLDPYKWKAWEGNYLVRAVVLPIAEIYVKRDSSDTITADLNPFINKAIDACAKSGGNFLCLLATKQNSKFLGIESVAFRAYKQVFQTGNKNLENYFNGVVTKGPPLKFQDLEPEEKKK